LLVNSEVKLMDFEFWSEAKETAKILLDEDFDQIEYALEDIYPEGIEETTLNDFFWFETNFIAEILGYNDWETLELEREAGELDE